MTLIAGPSGIHGWGVFTDQPIPAGGMVGRIKGQVKHVGNIPKDLLDRAFEVFRDHYVVPPVVSFGWFLNHSDWANCVYQIDTRDVRAIRDIEPGEELTIDYRLTTTWKEYSPP